MTEKLNKSSQDLTADRPGAFLADPVGIGLRPEHFDHVLEAWPKTGWLEVHPENYFGGGRNRHILRECAKHYP